MVFLQNSKDFKASRKIHEKKPHPVEPTHGQETLSAAHRQCPRPVQVFEFGYQLTYGREGRGQQLLSSELSDTRQKSFMLPSPFGGLKRMAGIAEKLRTHEALHNVIGPRMPRHEHSRGWERTQEEVCPAVEECGQRTAVRVRHNLGEQGRAARYRQGRIPKADRRLGEARTGSSRAGQSLNVWTLPGEQGRQKEEPGSR